MKKLFGFVLLIFIIGLLLFTYNRYTSRTIAKLKELDDVDRIELFKLNRNGDSVPLRTIDDTGQINSIIAIFEKLADNWYYEYPYPRGNISINFYTDSDLVTSIMLGSTEPKRKDRYFLSYFWGPTKFISENEYRELIFLLKLEANQ